jgi:hypothetical protein
MDEHADFQSRDAARDHEIGERVVIDAHAFERMLSLARAIRAKCFDLCRV